MSCQYHHAVQFQLGEMDKRISRVEKFIVGLLVTIAISFVSTLYALLDLPARIANYDRYHNTASK